MIETGKQRHNNKPGVQLRKHVRPLQTYHVKSSFNNFFLSAFPYLRNFVRAYGTAFWNRNRGNHLSQTKSIEERSRRVKKICHYFSYTLLLFDVLSHLVLRCTGRRRWKYEPRIETKIRTRNVYIILGIFDLLVNMSYIRWVSLYNTDAKKVAASAKGDFLFAR